MPVTLLSVIQGVCKKLPQIGYPSAAFASANPDLRQMVALVQEEGDDLVRRHDWPRIQKIRTFTCLAQQEQTNEPPTDFVRMCRHSTVWNTSRKQPMTNVPDETEWDEVTIRSLTAWPQMWQLRGGKLQVFPPVLDEGHQYRYISSYWIAATGASTLTKAAFTADTDEPCFPEDVLKFGVLVRWKQSKGLDYSKDEEDYALAKTLALKDAKGQRRITTDITPLDAAAMRRTWPPNSITVP